MLHAALSINVHRLCSISHNDRVLFEPTNAIWVHIARGKAECNLSPVPQDGLNSTRSRVIYSLYNNLKYFGSAIWISI